MYRSALGFLTGTSFVFGGSAFGSFSGARMAPPRQSEKKNKSRAMRVDKLMSILPAQPSAVNIENCKCRCRVHRASGVGRHNRRPNRNPPAQSFPASKSRSVAQCCQAHPALRRTRRRDKRGEETRGRNKIPSHRSNEWRAHFRFVECSSVPDAWVVRHGTNPSGGGSILARCRF